MKRALTLIAAAALALGLMAAPALATHTHAKATGQDRTCVLLAQNGGEENVNLPENAFNENTVVSPTPDRNHPLHVLVHKGKPGSDGGYWVYDNLESAAHCDTYVNLRS